MITFVLSIHYKLNTLNIIHYQYHFNRRVTFADTRTFNNSLTKQNEITNKTNMNTILVKEKLQSIIDKGYIFTISGVKSNKQICLVKDDKGILLYKGFWQNGQQWHSHPGAFKLADKINLSFLNDGRLIQTTPAMMRPLILEIAKPVNVTKATF